MEIQISKKVKHIPTGDIVTVVKINRKTLEGTKPGKDKALHSIDVWKLGETMLEKLKKTTTMEKLYGVVGNHDVYCSDILKMQLDSKILYFPEKKTYKITCSATKSDGKL